jgi:hypothetical protein
VYDNPLYMDEREFCRRYDLKHRTVQRWRVTGEGPPYVRSGKRRIKYNVAVCDSWFAARTFAHRAAEVAAITSQPTA